MFFVLFFYIFHCCFCTEKTSMYRDLYKTVLYSSVSGLQNHRTAGVVVWKFVQSENAHCTPTHPGWDVLLYVYSMLYNAASSLCTYISTKKQTKQSQKKHFEPKKPKKKGARHGGPAFCECADNLFWEATRWRVWIQVRYEGSLYRSFFVMLSPHPLRSLTLSHCFLRTSSKLERGE